MKHTNIGLVALATVLIAGCGGGSGKTTETMEKETEDRTVMLPVGHGLSAGADGKPRSYILNSGDNVFAVSGGTTTLTCEGEDGCTLMVSEDDEGEYVAMYTGGKVTVKHEITPARVEDDDDADDTDDSAEKQRADQEKQRADQEKQRADREKQRADQEKQRADQEKQRADQEKQRADSTEEQGNLRVRVPKLLASGEGLLVSAEGSATVMHMRGKSQTIDFSGIDNYDRTTPLSISGWKGSLYTFDGTDHKRTLRLYTNIDAPDARGAGREFWKAHSAALKATGYQLSNLSSLEDLATGRSAVAQKLKNNGDAGDDDDYNTVRGSNEYDRVTFLGQLGRTPGRFTCNLCERVSDDDDPVDTGDYVTFKSGKVEFAASGNGVVTNWTFTPTSPTAPYYDGQDDTYLYFGVWARHPDKEGEAYDDSNFQWVRGGGTAALTAPDSLEGTAKFTGGAIGEYAIGEVGSGEDKREASAGSFTATASLTANFGNSTDSTATLSGKISGFEENGSPLGWGSLTLGGSDLNDPASTYTIGGATGSTGNLTIEGTSVTGTWNANLYGVLNENDADGERPTGATCQDTGCAAELAGVAGWFRADGGIVGGGADTNKDVAIVGAFGAAYTGQ